MRGQLSIEFMIVLTGLLIIVAVTTMPLYDKARADAEKVTKLADAREAANTLANAVNTLYASGPGAKQVIEYWLPKGVVAIYIGGYENLNVDGVDTTDENVSRNGRADVQIWLDLNGDGALDNKREAVVIVDTLLPSRWYENGDARAENWIKENCLHVEDKNLKVGSAHGTLIKRTLHRTTLTYCYNPGHMYPRRIVVSDEIIRSA
ncbi:MAG: class III signal peptide-containing protein [Candidatus Hodarchaeaceae archaeon]|nr:class III signal peptide-containing protein [Candidatus Hodarchaeaceae archaeon]